MIMTEKPSKEDAEASVMKLEHPDPSGFSIITENGTESSYIAFTGSGLSGGDELIRITENKWLSRLLQTAWNNKISLCVCSPLFCVLAVIICSTILSFIVTCMLSMAKLIAWIVALSFIPCIYLMFQTHLSIKSAQKLHGTVVGHIEKKGSLYALDVEYYDRYEMKRRIKSSSSSSSPERGIGDTVIVLEYADGSEPKLFLSVEEFVMLYWIWLCACIGVCGLLALPPMMEWLYL